MASCSQRSHYLREGKLENFQSVCKVVLYVFVDVLGIFIIGGL